MKQKNTRDGGGAWSKKREIHVLCCLGREVYAAAAYCPLGGGGGVVERMHVVLMNGKRRQDTPPGIVSTRKKRRITVKEVGGKRKAGSSKVELGVRITSCGSGPGAGRHEEHS